MASGVGAGLNEERLGKVSGHALLSRLPLRVSQADLLDGVDEVVLVAPEGVVVRQLAQLLAGGLGLDTPLQHAPS